MTAGTHHRPPGRAVRRWGAPLGALALTCGLLSACSANADGGPPELTWYINPDAGGQAAVAENCTKASEGRYTINTQVLPQDAGEQRIQLARRLAAKDTGIDLMSIDPPYTAEFAEAGFLAEVPQEAIKDLESYGTFKSAMDAATWEDELVVFPFWSNTQVLWYRKSFAEKAGMDITPTTELTWDEIIDAAASENAQVAVQANKYEGYVVWINALIEGAGGHIAENTEKGVDADITIGEEAGQEAAGVIEKLAAEAAPPDLSVSNEGTGASTFAGDAGSFMVNWTFIFHNYDETAPDVAKDIGYTRYPQTVKGEESAPPYGGIGIGVSEYSDEKELALEAAACLVEPENQGVNAELTGNMPASEQGYEYPALKEAYPDDLRQLFQDSLDSAAPRTVSPYWSDISGAIQASWHPANSVDSETAEESKTEIEDVIHQRKLL